MNLSDLQNLLLLNGWFQLINALIIIDNQVYHFV